ncbi:MAG: MFS transporter [Pseudomonadota bacterium]
MKKSPAQTYLFLGLFTAFAALMVANPVLPPLARKLGISEIETGIIISISALMLAIVSPLWGGLSERIGRKSVFVTGLVGYAIGMGLFAGVAHLGLNNAFTGMTLLIFLVMSRLIVGIMIAAVPVSSQAYMADITDTENRSAGMAMMGAANGLGTLLGPAIGALLVTFGLLVPLYASAFAVFAIALLIMIALPASPKPRKLEKPPKLSPFDRRILPFLLIGLMTMLAIVLLQVTIGFYLIDQFSFELEAAAQTTGILLVIVGVCLAFVQGVIVTRFKWPPQTLLRFGLPILTVGLTVMIISTDIKGVMAAFAVMGVGAGLIFPGFTSGASLSVSDQEQGSVAGLIGAFNGAGAVVGPIAGTALYQVSSTAPYIASIIILVILTFFIWTNSVNMKSANTKEANA